MYDDDVRPHHPDFARGAPGDGHVAVTSNDGNMWR